MLYTCSIYSVILQFSVIYFEYLHFRLGNQVSTEIVRLFKSLSKCSIELLTVCHFEHYQMHCIIYTNLLVTNIWLSKTQYISENLYLLRKGELHISYIPSCYHIFIICISLTVKDSVFLKLAILFLYCRFFYIFGKSHHEIIKSHSKVMISETLDFI